jgi:hypothetical protein
MDYPYVFPSGCATNATWFDGRWWNVIASLGKRPVGHEFGDIRLVTPDQASFRGNDLVYRVTLNLRPSLRPPECASSVNRQ